MTTEQGTIHSRIYAELRGRIDSGAWPAGERIPTELELVREFGVSRAPIRQALAQLRADGVVAGGRGASPRVQAAVPVQPFESFVSFTDWAVSLGRDPGQRVLETRRRAAMPEEAAALALDVGAEVVTIVRLRTLDDAPAMLERSVFGVEVGTALASVDLDRESIYRTMRAHGFVPVRARHLIDAVAADEVDARALGCGPGDPLLRVRRTATGEQGDPIELADDRYLPHIATFAIENSIDRRVQVSRSAPDPAPE